MSYFSVATAAAAAKDGRAPRLMNLGSSFVCKSHKAKVLNKWITDIQMCITEEFDSIQTDALGLLVICLFYGFWHMV